jgi:lipopolysaccharide export system permease protein
MKNNTMKLTEIYPGNSFLSMGHHFPAARKAGKLYNHRVILARYLIGQFLPPFFFGLSIFSGVLLLDKIFDLIDLLINKGVSLWVSAQFFALFFPTILSLSVPMSILLACLLTFGRLSEDNEILALQASGLSFRQILWPPLAMGVLLSLVLLPFNTHLTPSAMNHFRALYHRISSTEPLIQIEPRRFIGFQNVRLYANDVSKDQRRLRGVWIFRLAPGVIERIYADRGQVEVKGREFTLHLEDGQMEHFLRKDPGEFSHVRFQKYTIQTSFQAPLMDRSRGWREYTTPGLQKEIDRRETLHLPVSALEAEKHLRYAMAFAPLALALIGVPFGLTLERGGRGVGFGASLGILFFYYLLLVMGLNVAEKGSWPAGPALWIANTVTATVGIFLFRRRTAP